MSRAVARLVRQQQPTGEWVDFFLTPGSSSCWVTGYTGTVLSLAASDNRLSAAVRARAGAAADRAADWLSVRQDADGGWGYRPSVRSDADSTAWVVRLLVIRGRTVPPSSWSFLEAHRDAGGGYRTYRTADESGSWAGVTPEVTAAVLLARCAAGLLSSTELADALLLVRRLLAAGGGLSHWWEGPGYPRAMCAELCALGGSPVAHGLSAIGARSSWEWATQLWSARFTGGVHSSVAARQLIAAQLPDGGWRGGATLLVPSARGAGITERSVDARGIFTTATAVRALLARPPRRAAPLRRIGADLTVTRPAAPVRRSGADLTVPRPAAPFWRIGADPAVRKQGASRMPSARAAAGSRDRAWDDPVGTLAQGSFIATEQPLRIFRALTARSLDGAVAWPSPQLSTLAAGTPLEFSVSRSPGLRLTVEVGDPVRPPRARMLSGLAALRRAAGIAGLSEEWGAAAGPLRVLTDPALPVPAGNRFWLWAGLDAEASGRTTVKAYASMLAEDVGGAPGRLDGFLAACGAAADSAAARCCAALAEQGWAQEAGVGATRGGWGAKVYFELSGFRPGLVSRILSLAGLDPDVAGLTPEVPGVLSASMVARSRAGIALRVVPGSGAVSEVTVAAAFPPALVGRAEVAARVQRWLDERGQGDPHRAAVDVLLPPWSAAPLVTRMHSLLTLSRSLRGDEVKVYLRPAPAPAPAAAAAVAPAPAPARA